MEQVGGIMRCASVLLESRHLNSTKDGRDVDDDVCQSNGLTDEEVYDSPRGLTKMPIRSENEDDNDWKMYDSKETKAIMQNRSVRSKMIKSDNGDLYFTVVTNRK
jgi:hypothetical protein